MQLGLWDLYLIEWVETICEIVAGFGARPTQRAMAKRRG